MGAIAAAALLAGLTAYGWHLFRFLIDDAYIAFRYAANSLAGWGLPEVAVIDRLGLNDRVVARTPRPPEARRMMAHDLVEPPGYAECFEPNLTARRERFREIPREGVLLDERIEACERRFFRLVTETPERLPWIGGPEMALSGGVSRIPG